MKEVECHELDRWGWECECGAWHEEEEDPGYMETVFCEECETESTPVVT